MKKVELPYVEPKTVKGHTYYYFRRGTSRTRLPGNPDSREFSDAYWALRSGRSKVKAKHTWNDLVIAFYKSPGFKSKAKGTQANYRRHYEDNREKNGDKSVTRFRRKHAIAARDSLADTWSKANERVAVLSILLNLAVDLEWIEQNPIVNVAKLEGGEYEAWPDDKLRAFENACDSMEATTARTVYELCVGTGQRIGDAVAMKWSDFDGEYMTVKQDKTGTPLEVYCPSRLRGYLSTLPRQGDHILARNLRNHIGKRAAQKAVEEVREAIGVRSGENRLVPHGWRYTAAKELAEADCSDADIQAVTGHKTLAMVQKYRAQAAQKSASKRAQQRREA